MEIFDSYEHNIKNASFMLASSVMSGKKYLGLDFGKKRVGVAYSDDRGAIVFPKMILKNDSELFQNLEKIIKEENVSEIVLGESLDLSGGENAVNKDIKIFAEKLKKDFGLPVHMQKEFMTSVGARNLRKSKSDSNVSGAHSRKKKDDVVKVDALAAALILERYLDKINL